MNSVLEINGKELHSIKDAMQAVSYSRDHITRLAREKKILATLIGKQWYVDLDSLQSYVESAHLEQQVRTERLSAERKRTLKVKQALGEAAKKRDAKINRAKKSARVAAAMVCTVGILSGVWLHSHGVAQLASVVNTLQSPEVTTSAPTVALAPMPVSFSEDSVNQYQSGGIEMRSRSYGSSATGVFLIPAAGTTTDPASLISDPVAVVETPTGQALVKVDANGVPFGEEIPFVVVPVPANVLNE